MTKQGFVIEDLDGETDRITLNGKEVITTNHDDHGWAGMAMARDVVKRIGKILKIPVEGE